MTGGRAGRCSAALDLLNVCHLRCALSRSYDVVRYFAGGYALLFDRSGDSCRNFRYPADGFAKFLDRDYGFTGGRLYASNLLANLFRRLGRLRCQRLDLGCDDRKPACRRPLPSPPQWLR